MAMSEVTNIALRLTITCIIAASLMGTVYVLTDNAKRHNESLNEEKVVQGLLGYSADHPAPEGFKVSTLYRYVLSTGDKKLLGYLLPLDQKGAIEYQLVVIDLEGRYQERISIPGIIEVIKEDDARTQQLNSALPQGLSARYADEVLVVSESGNRKAYLLPGHFLGFKTTIKVILALDPNLAILGFEVLEHEEDPGLGGEIEKPYFKNQFVGKTVEVMKNIKVVKIPLPVDYRDYLEGEILEEEARATLQQQYAAADIHAITGATISSDAINNGLKNMVRKFAYRLNILESVVQQNAIPVGY